MYCTYAALIELGTQCNYQIINYKIQDLQDEVVCRQDEEEWEH